ncbi:hypothetical protein BH23BAC4_BH23BAC4_11240 [soil metagenome]
MYTANHPEELQREISAARRDWLAGDREAWTRYTQCLKMMEEHRMSARRADAARKRLAARCATRNGADA